MILPEARQPDLEHLADVGRWEDLLQFAATATVDNMLDRLTAAHLVTLEGPLPVAAIAAELFPDDRRGWPGPLWEVVALRPWRDLDRHLTNPRIRFLVAHTRVLHGEDLRDAAGVEAFPGPPLCLQPWETAGWDPEYHMVDYNRMGSAGATIWNCPRELTNSVLLPRVDVPVAQHDAVRILDALSPWASASAFHGTAWEAAAMVVPRGTTCRSGRMAMADVYADLINLATGIAAYDWRTGHASGRIALWEALAVMVGSAPEASVRDINDFVERVRLVGWLEETKERPPLYHFNLAIEDPEQGISWVLKGQSDD